MSYNIILSIVICEMIYIFEKNLYSKEFLTILNPITFLKIEMRGISMEANLPKDFITRMQEMLGEEFPLFLEHYEKPREYGLRVNTLKISCEEFESLCPFPIERIPWVPNGYFYPPDVRPSLHPYYQAGLYYLQEPSAMTPAACLPVQPGDAVLDLCAAPGGKATELAACLRGEGILIANDISSSRAKALLRNLELFGVSNLVVTSEKPERLADRFPEFFHKILLDAPCSGEGMFRKDENLIRDWSTEKSDKLAQIQRELILDAARMLRPGGLLLYSTCTFAPAEDEGTISWLLEHCPEFSLQPLPSYPGFSPGVPRWGNEDPSLSRCVRIWPHKMRGEGHFLALLKKEGESVPLFQPKKGKKKGPDKASAALLNEFFQNVKIPFDPGRVEIRNEKVYYLPPVDVSALRGLHFLRNGLYLGDLKKNRFEPSQPLALALGRNGFTSMVHLDPADDRISKYLKGETLNLQEEEISSPKGWQLVCAGDFPLGWGKLVGQTLKNKYPSGWRI